LYLDNKRYFSKMKNTGEDMKWDDLRSKAIRVMNIKSDTGKPLSDETTKLIQELDFYRIEMELENKRMILANELAGNALNEYIQLFDNAPSAFIVLSLDGNIKKINQLGAGLLGHERLSLIDTPFENYLSTESKVFFNNFLNELYEKKIRQTIDVCLSVDYMRSSEIEISGIFSESSKEYSIILLDITKYKKTEKHLVQSKEKAETADRLKSSFLSTMSHEIRAPLNSIIGFSGILMKEIPGSLNAEQKKQMGMIQSSGRHLLSLINDLLDLSKIEAGQLSVNFEYFNLEEVLDDVLQLEWPFATSKNIILNLKKSSDISIIRSDKQRIHQVLLNIVNNAIKYTEKGQVDIYCQKEKDSIHIIIKDSGIGIKEENLEKIFDPFIQIDNDLTKSNRGSGLGLPVTRKLIELLHGSVNVISEYGKGSTFIIILPIEVSKKIN
jgi:PAS domain S-box-containing protein